MRGKVRTKLKTDEEHSFFDQEYQERSEPRRINLNDDSEKSTKRNNAINTNSLSSGLRINKLKYHHIGLGSMTVKNENEKLSYNNNDINYMNFRLNRVRY